MSIQPAKSPAHREAMRNDRWAAQRKKRRAQIERENAAKDDSTYMARRFREICRLQ